MNKALLLSWTPAGRSGLARLMEAYLKVLDIIEHDGAAIRDATPGDAEWWQVSELLDFSTPTMLFLCEGGRPLDERRIGIQERLEVLKHSAKAGQK